MKDTPPIPATAITATAAPKTRPDIPLSGLGLGSVVVSVGDVESVVVDVEPVVVEAGTTILMVTSSITSSVGSSNKSGRVSGVTAV